MRLIKAVSEITVPARPGDVVRIVSGNAAVKVVAFNDGKRTLATLQGVGSTYKCPAAESKP